VEFGWSLGWFDSRSCCVSLFGTHVYRLVLTECNSVSSLEAIYLYFTDWEAAVAQAEARMRTETHRRRSSLSASARSQ
jgi:hypothetical protein